VQAYTFEPLLNGFENTECIGIREKLFKRHWAKAEESIQVGVRQLQTILVLTNLQSILGQSNENTLVKVTSFVQDATALRYLDFLLGWGVG
jgi:hypothetical protein